MNRTISIAFALLAVACSHTSEITGKPEVIGWEDNLRRLAAFDLNCDAKELDITPLGGFGPAMESAGVQGCGQRRTYTQIRGTWIKN